MRKVPYNMNSVTSFGSIKSRWADGLNLDGLQASLLWRIGKTQRDCRNLPDGLYVFTFHRIGDRRSTPFDSNVFSCTQAGLREHITAIKQSFQIIDPTEIMQLSARPQKGRFALLTFDDGYRDNFTQALPELRTQDVAAIFFVCPSFIEGNEPPWWDKIAYMVKHSTRREIRLNSKDIQVRNRAIEISVREVLREFKLIRAKSADKLLMLQELLQPTDEPPLERLFMNWEELSTVRDHGIIIGSHTLTHDKLAHLSDDEQLQELAQSKHIIDEKLQQDTQFLAYPVGGDDSFTAKTCELARLSGFRYAFTTEQHFNGLDAGNQMTLGRFPIASERPATSHYTMLKRAKKSDGY